MKIRVERQGESECMLASIAAITGKPLADIRARACEIAKVDEWKDAFDTAGLFWSSIESLGRELGIGYMMEATSARTGGIGQSKGIPKKGRGIIIITRGKGGHAMPFQAGLIYDPNYPKTGQNLDATLENYPGYKVSQIIMHRDDSLNHECPTCGAPRGKHCRYPSGYVKSESHASRKH